MRPLGTNFSEILIKIKKNFIHENASEDIVCEMAAILSRGRWVKLTAASSRYSNDKYVSQTNVMTAIITATILVM